MTDFSSVSTIKDFAEWIKAAEPGDAVIYYTGNNVGGVLCRFAMRMCDEGYIALVRRRIDTEGLSRFQFEAQRTRKRMR